MQNKPTSHPAPLLPSRRWRLRDSIAAAGLFLATAAVVLWQNAHLVILWDLSYVLDTATRIALGQMPYRDFPLAHAPLTFLIQAATIRLAGRVFFHHVLYAATVGGLGTVLTWRIALDTLRGRLATAWAVSLLLAAPLTVLGIYCILPHPSYDCDCAFSILVAVFLLQRLTTNITPAQIGAENHAQAGPALRGHDFSRAAIAPKEAWALAPGGRVALFTSRARPFAAGAALVLPVFFKQNIGLPFLLVAGLAILLLLAARLLGRAPASPGVPALLAVLAGAATTLLAAGLLIHFTVGLDNYLHWTIRFAAQRRLPGLESMVGVYRQPSLLWMLPCVAAAIAPMCGRLAKAQWARLVALGLLSAPFLWTLMTLFLYEDADERGDSLLALWPLLLVLSAALTLFNLRRGLSLRALLPVLLLGTIHGTLLSQQLWGSTYAIWPLLILLIAEAVVFVGELGLQGEVLQDRVSGAKARVNVAGHMHGPKPVPFTAASFFAVSEAVVIAATLLVCGAFYTAGEERLSYAQLPEGPVLHATFPQLAGMAAPGPYLPEFEELLRFAAANIPASDGLILIPGEDPFYFATGRAPQFPVLLFDPATDPLSPAQVVEQVRAHNIRWLIVKRDLQIKEDVTPQREATMNALQGEFALSGHLRGYDVYRRRKSETSVAAFRN
jgi:hypothetical protein